MSDKTASPTPTEDKPAEKPRPIINANAIPTVELLLIAGLGVVVLNYLLGWGLFGQIYRSRPSIVPRQRVNPATPQQPAAPANSNPATPSRPQIRIGSDGETGQSSTSAQRGTHQVRCAAGNQGVNFRPNAGFSTPRFAIPCGNSVTVVGNAVRVQNETWSPIVYGNRRGWAATKLLQPLR